MSFCEEKGQCQYGLLWHLQEHVTSYMSDKIQLSIHVCRFILHFYVVVWTFSALDLSGFIVKAGSVTAWPHALRSLLELGK